MRNLCMTVSYVGTAYNGFQTQPGLETVQKHIEDAIMHLTGEETKIIASGRTDAGVHAIGQVFNFTTASAIPIRRWCLALNTRLPKDIVVWKAIEVPLDFHSRRSAKRKTYRYTINNNRFPDVFQRHTQFHHPTPLDVEAMRNGLSYLVGEHDFTSFTSRHSTKQSHVRTVYEATLEIEQPGVIHIDITGNGFLYNMVRIIVGTLVWVGEGKLKSEQMANILAAQDRSFAGPTAVAHGLTLCEVFYEGIENGY